MPTILTYQEVVSATGLDTGKTVHLLLGNGFSVGCDPIFQYSHLYQRAVANGLSDEAKQLFTLLGTNNFEGVMRLLQQSTKVAEIYQLGSTDDRIKLSTDLEVIKQTLIRTIAENHLPAPSAISGEKMTACIKALRPFTHIFTTNYDLIPYWILMEDLVTTPFDDGFRQSEDDGSQLCFTSKLKDKRGVLFLHGALHLYVEGGEVRKHSWKREGRPIVELVTEGLHREQYPLFIAEGESQKKKEQIVGNAYLAYCWSKFGRIESPLIVYGHSLSVHDTHILHEIIENTNLHDVYVSIYGDPDSSDNLKLITTVEQLVDARNKLVEGRPKADRQRLTVYFFNAESMQIWG
jgi:hypothetical protein